jgi:hypothetical protein
MNFVEFIRQFLRIVGVPEADIDDNVSKILYTVLLSVIKYLELNDERVERLEIIGSMLKEGNKQESIDSLMAFFEDVGTEEIREVFIQRLIDYLLDMTDKLGNTLTEQKKKQLGDIINNFGTE